jgi:hypothetical protein
MDAQTIQVVMIVVTLLVAGYALYRSYQADHGITLSAVAEQIKEAQPVVLQLREVVEIAVQAAEQLKREGSIQSNDEALNHALNLVKQWIPDEWEVSNRDIIESINSAVLVASALSRQAGKSSETVEPQVGWTHGTTAGQ